MSMPGNAEHREDHHRDSPEFLGSTLRYCSSRRHNFPSPHSFRSLAEAVPYLHKTEKFTERVTWPGSSTSAINGAVRRHACKPKRVPLLQGLRTVKNRSSDNAETSHAVPCSGRQHELELGVHCRRAMAYVSALGSAVIHVARQSQR